MRGVVWLGQKACYPEPGVVPGRVAPMKELSHLDGHTQISPPSRQQEVWPPFPHMWADWLLVAEKRTGSTP